jgi:RecA-family ATPase
MNFDWNDIGLQNGPDGVRAAFDAGFAAAKPSRLEFFTAAELQRMELPPIKFTIDGYVAEGLTILAGKPKIGKSWMALDWALAVAYGGFALGSILCSQGDVLYAALEDNQRRLKKRIQQLMPPGSEWPDQLSLCTAIRRLDAGGIDDVRAWANSVPSPRLVIIDTFALFRPPRQREANYDSDYAALSPLQNLAAELGLAIVVVHHVRKLESVDPLDTVSGTTGLTGAADTVLVLNRDAQGITLYGRGRDIDEVETAMSLDKATGQWTVLGAAVEVRRSDQRKVILEALQQGQMTVSDLIAATGMERNSLNQLLFKMAKSGDIVRVGRGVYALPATPDKNDK